MSTSIHNNQLIAAWKYSVLTLLVVLSTGFAFPSLTLAKSDNNGAYTFKDAYCFTLEGITVCYANSGVVQGVATPSGNTAFIGVGSSSYTEIDSSGALLYEDTLSYHTTGLNKEDALFALQQSFTQELTVGVFSCKTTYSFLIVKGEILFDRVVDCS